jgi:hypothetical protein
MISKTDQLLAAYEKVVNEPWATALSGQEKIWFLVYDPAEQRKVDLRLSDFETATLSVEKKWFDISLKSCFPIWMANHDYKTEYFEDPDALIDQLETDFKPFVVDFIVNRMIESNCDENTLVALKDISSLFGYIRMSDVLNGCASAINGRMLIFFPGEYDKNQYRLLDARDGWSYLARPITV